MRLIYSTGIFIYGLILKFASLFNEKAKLWVAGRKGIFPRLSAAVANVNRLQNPIVWFHVSSLGEFEQARPVIEAIKEKWPEKKILLTFFSPSGYEIRKRYELADFVFYLPLDTLGNARRFMEIVKPEMVFFVKYDFWFNYIKVIHNQQVPLYYISALFRKNHHFFKWYGCWFRRHLRYVEHFFVQDQESVDLLNSIKINQVTRTGDTRFDRVFAIATQAKPFPLIEKFCDDKPVFIAGSSWEPDEAVFLPLINHERPGKKYIIAPHDTRPERVGYIREHLTKPSVCYSALNEENADHFDVLIIDSVGILNQLYQYATVAFIGGGFGSGLHNIQEPVTFGVPVFFGPRYHKFREARDLVALGGAFSVVTTAELIEKIRPVTDDRLEHQRISAICKNYVAQNIGATEKVMQVIIVHLNAVSLANPKI